MINGLEVFQYNQYFNTDRNLTRKYIKALVLIAPELQQIVRESYIKKPCYMISITFDYITASRALKLPCFEKVKRSNIYFYLYLLSPQLLNYGKTYNKICVYIPTLR